MKGLKIKVHASHIQAVVNRRAHYLYLRIACKLLGIFIGNLKRELDITSLDEGASCGLRRNLANDDPAQGGLWPTDPVFVAYVDQLLASIPALHLISSASLRIGMQKLCGPGIGCGGFCLSRLGIDDHCNRHREIGQCKFGWPL